MGRILQDSEGSSRAVLLEIPRWSWVAGIAAGASLFVMLLALFFVVVWMAFSLGTMVGATTDAAEALQDLEELKAQVKVDHERLHRYDGRIETMRKNISKNADQIKENRDELRPRPPDGQ